MTLQPSKVTPRVCTPQTRARALAAVEHAVIEAAQRATELSDWNWCVQGTQTRAYGENRELVIRLAPFATSTGQRQFPSRTKAE